jgi:hypothetical protein
MIEVGSPPALGAINYQRLIISKIAAANCPRSCDFADFRFGSLAAVEIVQRRSRFSTQKQTR